MKWILILTLFRPYSEGFSSIESVEFNTKEQCVVAQQAWMSRVTTDSGYVTVSAFCVAKG